MSFADLLTFKAVLIVALLSPGPALLFALRIALADGRWPMAALVMGTLGLKLLLGK